MQIDLALTVNGSPQHLSIPSPVPDSWYIVYSMPTEARVKFFWSSGIEGSGQRQSAPPALTVRPGITTGTATIRAGRVGSGRCEAEIYDALGNYVRTLELRGRALPIGHLVRRR